MKDDDSLEELARRLNHIQDFLKCTLIFIVSVIALIVVIHLQHAEASRANPPAACQLFGGSWNIWNGWTCQ